MTFREKHLGWAIVPASVNNARGQPLGLVRSAYIALAILLIPIGLPVILFKMVCTANESGMPPKIFFVWRRITKRSTDIAPVNNKRGWDWAALDRAAKSGAVPSTMARQFTG